jgi:hypothetical protein
VATIRKILCAIDLTKASGNAFERAVSLCRGTFPRERRAKE